MVGLEGPFVDVGPPEGLCIGKLVLDGAVPSIFWNEGFMRRSERACSVIDLFREADRSGAGGLDASTIPVITWTGVLKRIPSSGLLALGSASLVSH